MPSNVLPTGWSATKVRNVIGSLRAGPAGPEPAADRRGHRSGRSAPLGRRPGVVALGPDAATSSSGAASGSAGRLGWPWSPWWPSSPWWPWWPWPLWPPWWLWWPWWRRLVPSPWPPWWSWWPLPALAALVALAAPSGFVRLGGLCRLGGLGRLGGLVALAGFAVPTRPLAEGGRPPSPVPSWLRGRQGALVVFRADLVAWVALVAFTGADAWSTGPTRRRRPPWPRASTCRSPTGSSPRAPGSGG